MQNSRCPFPRPSLALPTSCGASRASAMTRKSAPADFAVAVNSTEEKAMAGNPRSLDEGTNRLDHEW
jgi:hypothetical protein